MIENTSIPSEPQVIASNKISGCLDAIVFLFVNIIGVIIVFGRHSITFGLTFNPDNTPRLAALIGVGIQIVILGIILLPLALFWPTQKRNFYSTLLYFQLLTLFCAPVYLLSYTATQSQTILLAIILAVFWGLYPLYQRIFNSSTPSPSSIESISTSNPTMISISDSFFMRLGLILVGLAGLPWVVSGALGSVLDTILMGILGLIFGALASQLIMKVVISYSLLPRTDPKTIVFNQGKEISLILLYLAGCLSFPFGGMQLLILISLPLFGWVVSVLQNLFPFRFDSKTSINFKNRRHQAVALMIALICSFPLIFIDPEEMTILLGTNSEIFTVAFQAAWWTAGIFTGTTLVGVLVLVIRRWMPLLTSNSNLSEFTRWASKGMAALVFIIGIISIVTYFKTGQPGFYGEHIFVILRDQTDLSESVPQSDFSDQRVDVYQTLVKKALDSQKGMRRTLDRFGISYKPFYLVNALEINANPLVYLWLSTQPEVDRILQNPILRPLPYPRSPEGGAIAAPTEILWNQELIQADRVWLEFGVRGEGIIIGQSDSGVQGDHTELADSYRGALTNNNDYNWYDPWDNSLSPMDIGGHGTHTLGTILGNHTGIAPEAQWIGCINLSRNYGNPAAYLECMQFMLAPFPLDGDPFLDGDPLQGANILNNSWGCPDFEGCDEDVFLPAVMALRAAGIFVVVSAGNDGPTCGSLIVPPATYSQVFSVGAIDRFGNIAQFSSIGLVPDDSETSIKPDVLAPGVDILSALPNNTYGYFSGTSMAGPHVAGTVALMWSANPDLIGNIDLTEQILRQSIDPYTGYLPECPGASAMPSTVAGYGIINAYQAVKIVLEQSN